MTVELPLPWVLALDLGTSSCRALVYDGAGNRIDLPECRRPLAATTDAEGANTFGPMAIETALAEVVDDALEALGEKAHLISAVVMDTIASSLLLTDIKGHPVSPLYTYADTRCAAAAALLRHQVDEAASHDRVGTRVHSSYHPARLRWFDTSRPDWRSHQICCVGEWLLWRWTGERRISLSAASWTGLLDRRTLTWDAPWLGLLGLDERQLGPLADFGDSVGVLKAPWAARWPALAKARWFQPIGDGAAANVGSGVAGPGRTALTLGTTAALRTVPAEVPQVLPMGAWNYRIDRRRPLVGAAMTEGGNVFDWACRLAGLVPGDHLDAQMALRPTGSHGLTFVPHLAGERAPNWNDAARGTISGLGLATDGIDIARAAVEGVAARLGLTRQMLGDVARGEVMASGGLLKSSFWKRMVTAALAQPIGICREAEATSRGAALLGLEALGVLRMEDVHTPTDATDQPALHDVEALKQHGARQERLRSLGVS